MPQTNADQARELARNSADCSFLLSHLIRQNEKQSDGYARNILDLILDLGTTPPNPTLKATATGWYGASSPSVFNPVTCALDGSIRNRAVCFTESTLSGLKAHRDLFQMKYGVAFDRDFLFEKGANPCLNIRESLLRSTTSFFGSPCTRYMYNFIPTNLQPFVNVIHDSFDATHEREWRYPGNLEFGWNEVEFIFCPESGFNVFQVVQSVAMPCFFDLAWLDRI